MKQLLLVPAVLVLTATGGASALGQPTFEYRHLSEPLGGPSRESGYEYEYPCVGLSYSPVTTGCILYDNTATHQCCGFSWGGFMIGDEVVLAGANCIVTELLIGLDASEPHNVDVTVQIYANDGADGKPGSLLWDSGWVTRWIPEGSPQQLISFPVPDVCVPGRITFAVEYQPSQGVGAESYGPATIGEWVRSWWKEGGQWYRAPEEEAWPFMARVIAQPCGASAVEQTSWGRIKSMYR